MSLVAFCSVSNIIMTMLFLRNYEDVVFNEFNNKKKALFLIGYLLIYFVLVYFFSKNLVFWINEVFFLMAVQMSYSYAVGGEGRNGHQVSPHHHRHQDPLRLLSLLLPSAHQISKRTQIAHHFHRHLHHHADLHHSPEILWVKIPYPQRTYSGLFQLLSKGDRPRNLERTVSCLHLGLRRRPGLKGNLE
jgi:hypothetical protein